MSQQDSNCLDITFEDDAVHACITYRRPQPALAVVFGISLIMWPFQAERARQLFSIAVNPWLWWTFVLGMWLLWLYFGITTAVSLKEEIVADKESLRVKLPFVRWVRYAWMGISGLGLTRFGEGGSSGKLNSPALKFLFDGKLILFGHGIDRESAAKLLECIQKFQLPDDPTTPQLQHSNTPEVNLDQLHPADGELE